MNGNVNWLEKYRPKKLSEYLGHRGQVDTIKRWIRSFKNEIPSTKRFLLLYGPPGVGKTTIAHIILKEYKFEVVEFNSSDLRNKEVIKRRIGTIGKRSITQILYAPKDINKVPKVGVIMDEIDGISSGDRGSINELIKIMCPNRKRGNYKIKERKLTFPIIFTCNKVNDKKLAPIRKEALEVKMDYPSDKILMSYAKRILENENIIIDSETLDMIVKESNNDFRKLVNSLYYLNLLKKNITRDDVNNNIDFGERNNGLYKNIEKMFNNDKSLSEIIKFSEKDPKVISQMFYRNYMKIIYKRKGEKNNKHLNIGLISDYVSIGDILHKYIYMYQYWELTNEMLSLQCASPCLLANNNLVLNTNNKTIIDNYAPLNRAYQEESAYRKNLTSLKSKLGNIDYDNIAMINHIFLKNIILPEGNFEEGIRMMKYYKLSLTDLEIMIRMSRNNTDIDYETIYKKQKKKIKKYLSTVK